MASVTKFTAGAVYNQLRHNLRQIAHSSNPDIDPVRLRQDYVLSPDRGMSDYDYFQERLSQLYVYGRNDVKVMAGWVVTAPQDLEQEQFDDFFLAVYDFSKIDTARKTSYRLSSTMTRAVNRICIFVLCLWSRTKNTRRDIRCAPMTY